MKKIIKVAIVGTGHIADQFHLPGLEKIYQLAEYSALPITESQTAKSQI